MNFRLLAITTLGVLAVAGCSSTDGSKAGELGNGGFYFACTDAVSCARYSDDAAKFPKAVSVGSSFQVRFTPKSSLSASGSDSHINLTTGTDRGITISPVGDGQSADSFISRGPNGLVAQRLGYGTIISRDAAGQIIDFVNIRVARPDALVVYDAAVARGDTPSRIEALTMSLSDSRQLRAFAQEKNSVLAGSLAVEWSVEPKSGVVDIIDSDGEVTITPRAAGTAKLTASGGTFSQEISVEVQR